MYSERIDQLAICLNIRLKSISEQLLFWNSLFVAAMLEKFLSGHLFHVSPTLKSIQAGVLQNSALSPTLFLSIIHNLISSTLNPMHSFADNRTFSCSYKLLGSKPVSSGILDFRKLILESLGSDIKIIFEPSSPFQLASFTRVR